MYPGIFDGPNAGTPVQKRTRIEKHNPNHEIKAFSESVYGLLNWNIQWTNHTRSSLPLCPLFDLNFRAFPGIHCGCIHFHANKTNQLYYSVFPFWTSVNLIFFTLASKKSGDVVQRNTSTTSVQVWAWHTPMVLRELHTGNDSRQQRRTPAIYTI